VGPVIELIQDRLFEHRERAFLMLRRLALKPVKDVDEFQTWWKSSGSKVSEDRRREVAETAAKDLARAESYDDRRRASDLLRNMPGGIGVVTCAPILANPKASNYFGEDDLAAWNTALAVPFLIERLGRDSTTTRKNALESLLIVCSKNPRIATLCWPLIRAQLAERDSGIRRIGETAVSAFAKSDGVDALLDGLVARGIYEPQECSKILYTLSGRTMGFSINEPQPDQLLARKHLRGWWDGARANFRAVSVSTPVNPFAILPGDVGKLRVHQSLDDATRATKLEVQSIAEDSDISEAAFGQLMVERGPDDAFWKKLSAQNRSRDRARGLLGSAGSSALVADLSKRIAGKTDSETPLTRALILLSLGASGESKGAGPKAVVAWLKNGDVPVFHPLKRLAVLSLGLANNEPESLAYLTGLVDAALKADAPDFDLLKPDEQDGPFALLRSALTALCARSDSNAALLRLLNESSETRVREVAARALALRRDRSAMVGIVKSLEKADRYTWMDIMHTLEPLMTADDGAMLCEMLDSAKSTTRSGAAWVLTRRLELGNDPQTRAKLIMALTDDVNLVRYYSAEALGRRKARSALDGLVKLLDDSDDDVKAAAAQALGELGDKDACVLASKAAQLQYRIDMRWWKALAISGTTKWAAEILKLANSNMYAEQRAGLEALSVTDSEGARERLLKAFRSDDEQFQTVAGDLLLERGDAAMALIKDDVASKNKATRARAVHFLARLNSAAGKAALNEALKNEDDAGIKALIEWGIARGK